MGRLEQVVEERLSAGRWRVSDVMETDVITTWPDAPITEVAGLMETRKIGCVPVLDEGKVVGIVTEADFVKTVRRLLERRRP